MLKTLKQLNSEPVVLLKKIEGFDGIHKTYLEHKLPDSIVNNSERDAMQRSFQIVKKSPDPKDPSSSSISLKINLTGGTPTCHKRKASLEDKFNEADSAYEIQKKQKKDEGFESDNKTCPNDKKKAKYHQDEGKSTQENKKLKDASDKEKEKLKKKDKVKISKSELHSETACSAGGGLSSAELLTKRSQKKDKKHDKKKKKSKEKSEKHSSSEKCGQSTSKRSLSSSSSRKQSEIGEHDESHLKFPIAASTNQQFSEESSEISLSIKLPAASADEVVTDEEVFEESAGDRTVALIVDENDCDLPRSDSAATVALDIDMERKSVHSDVDDEMEPVEFVNLVSPEKPMETTAFIPSDIRTESPIEESTEEPLELSPENDTSPTNCEEDKNEDHAGSLCGPDEKLASSDNIEPTESVSTEHLIEQSQKEGSDNKVGSETSTNHRVLQDDSEKQSRVLNESSSTEEGVSKVSVCSEVSLLKPEAVECNDGNDKNRIPECKDAVILAVVDEKDTGEIAKIASEGRSEGESESVLPEAVEEEIPGPSTTEQTEVVDSITMDTEDSPSPTTDVNHKEVSPATTPLPVENADNSKSTQEQNLLVKICCIPIDVLSEQLEQQELNLRQEQVDLRTTISETFFKHQSLKKELDSLALTVRDLEEKSTVKNEGIAADVLLVETLSAEVNESREERNRLFADKKKTVQLVLQTEMKLRELQVELCRKQLEVDSDIKLDETHPLFSVIRDYQIRVSNLTDEVATKSITHKETEATFQKADQIFQQKNEKYEAVLKHLEETRKSYQELRENLNQFISKIDEIKLELKSLFDERKKKCLRSIDVEEELIKIETCKKFKENELKRQKIISAEDDEIFEDFSLNSNSLPSVKDKETKRETLSENTTSCVIREPERLLLTERSPVPPQSPQQKFTQPNGELPVAKDAEPISNVLTPTTDSTVILGTSGVLPEASSQVSLQVEMETDPSSPQTQPICLRVSPAVVSNSSITAIIPGSSTTSVAVLGSPTLLQGSPAAAHTIPSSTSPVIRMVDSLSHMESSPQPSSHNLIPPLFSQSSQQISVNSLNDVFPFYVQMVTSGSNGQISNSNDETLLYQEIINGCRQFVNWKNNISKESPSCIRDVALLHQSAGYVKEYFIPFYRLLLLKNTSITVLIDLIIQQAQKANWYGMPAVDPTYMKEILEANLRYAIEIGITCKEKSPLPPSRVEFSPSSGSSSIPTFTIHPANSEPFRSPTLPNQLHISVRNPTERSQNNIVSQAESSPIGALNSMLTNQVRQTHHQSPSSLPTGSPAQHSPNTLPSEGHPGLTRQGWLGNPINNCMVGYQHQPSVVQNSSVVAHVVPMMNSQFNGRHRMPSVQQTVPTPHSTWSQQSTHPGYGPNHPMQSSRMPLPSYSTSGLHRQQQQPSHQNQYIGPSCSQQMGLQHHHRLAGPIVVDNPSRQNMPVIGSQHQGQVHVQQQRIRQHSASQPAACQQPGSHHPGGSQQQVPHPQVHLLSGHQTMQQQRHLPMPSPPMNAQPHQRHFTNHSSEISRQPVVLRRPSQDQVPHQQQPQHTYTCLKCGLEAQQKCSGCQTTFYCSRDCQVAHWEEHGKTCSKQV